MPSMHFMGVSTPPLLRSIPEHGGPAACSAVYTPHALASSGGGAAAVPAAASPPSTTDFPATAKLSATAKSFCFKPKATLTSASTTSLGQLKKAGKAAPVVSGRRAASSASRRAKASGQIGRRPLLVALNGLATALKAFLASTGGKLEFSSAGLQPFFEAFPEQRVACQTHPGLLAGVVAKAKSLKSVPPPPTAAPGAAPTIELLGRC